MGQRSLQAVLFDLDGTLLDTAPDFALVLNIMKRRRDQQCIPYARVRETVSDGARALVTMAFNIQPDEPDFEPLRAELLSLYDQHLGTETRPFEGIPELLGALGDRQLPWGVVTNKPSWLAEPLLQRISLHPPMSVLICPDHVTHTKPDPEPMLLACTRLHTQPAHTVYIGDHDRDIQAGRAAGMPTVAAAYGYVHSAAAVASWQADFEVGHASDILPLLQHHFL